MNSTKRKIGTLIATLGLAVTAGGVTAALAAGSTAPSPSSATISSTPPVNDDGTADQGRGDVTATNAPATGTPSVGDDGTADQGPGDVPAEQGEDHGDNSGPGNVDEGDDRGPGGRDDNSGHSGHDDNSGHEGEGVQHG